MAIFAVDLIDIFFISLLGIDELAASAGYASMLMFFSSAINIGLSIADTVFREETKSSAYAVNLSIKTEIYESDTIPVSKVPGMIAQVDIIRGERTILEYFWQPVAKMKDTAFRE